ncbi:uncharacterized protein F5891DRAFT_536989 [Suillus fuscotomentosus]|uniref:Uncharacterized protein n=1 Tax=Suillus fuscotomentosus TaxID=1912939 RepID=A0AAD4E336_9AGAM|nr:uncharacterized protein F5891DRAFT_536989 [Suillus fuscotomentosus]KAG1897408.1 hypothetical protein F5891DRAFT_536989 [Suillus fuscotomentosus]
MYHTRRYCFRIIRRTIIHTLMYPCRSQDEPIIIVSFHYITSSHKAQPRIMTNIFSFVLIILVLVHSRIICPQPLTTILQRTLYTLSNSSQRFKGPSSQPGVSFLMPLYLAFVFQSSGIDLRKYVLYNMIDDLDFTT